MTTNQSQWYRSRAAVPATVVFFSVFTAVFVLGLAVETASIKINGAKLRVIDESRFLLCRNEFAFWLIPAIHLCVTVVISTAATALVWLVAKLSSSS